MERSDALKQLQVRLCELSYRCLAVMTGDRAATGLRNALLTVPTSAADHCTRARRFYSPYRFIGIPL